MWAQRPFRKPGAWNWAGSPTRVLDFIRIARQVSGRYNIKYIDIYEMTLPLMEFNEDGIHFLPEVNRPIAMLLAEFLRACRATK